MVKVTGRTGKVVQVDIRGLVEVELALKRQKHKIIAGADFGVVKAGTFIEEEVKESIMGNRVEHMSVTTGLLANSIEFKRIGKAQGVVKSRKKSYPNSNQTTDEVAKIIEYSTRIPGGPRLHFKNTEVRNRKNIKKIIEENINSKMREKINFPSSFK